MDVRPRRFAVGVAAAVFPMPRTRSGRSRLADGSSSIRGASFAWRYPPALVQAFPAKEPTVTVEQPAGRHEYEREEARRQLARVRRIEQDADAAVRIGVALPTLSRHRVVPYTSRTRAWTPKRTHAAHREPGARARARSPRRSRPWLSLLGGLLIQRSGRAARQRLPVTGRPSPQRAQRSQDDPGARALAGRARSVAPGRLAPVTRLHFSVGARTGNTRRPATDHRVSRRLNAPIATASRPNDRPPDATLVASRASAGCRSASVHGSWSPWADSNRLPPGSAASCDQHHAFLRGYRLGQGLRCRSRTERSTRLNYKGS